MRICFASHNKNKVKEMSEIMPDGNFLIGLDELGITEDISETGSTLEENATIKSSYVYKKHKIPVFADDSGLIVHALNGEPGVYSARYAGEDRDDQKNMDLLLKNLSDKNDRSAEFRTVISYIDEAGKNHEFTGKVEGQIIKEKRGNNGFGYDPIFQPKGFDETFAELSSEVKNRISHRAKAVQKFLEYLHQINE
ncbi:RdgB/HAM1 family non-canonical purine NTP pyrophosphatase [Ekhidna sp.]|jgi:XTP/dITP diphosphohydrolase|uniref:RdgB/HAM1 family non-canonical purine NTP pyrophosphatase n=1 Tax=Ekhidna sp. TaxID=2608089 RepID=UPI0032ECEAE7